MGDNSTKWQPWLPWWLIAPLCPQLVKAIIESGQITCEFQVQHLTKADAGLWECRVSTTGGQDSRKVKVNIRGEERTGGAGSQCGSKTPHKWTTCHSSCVTEATVRFEW